MSNAYLVVVAIVVVALSVAALVIIRRQRYVRALRGRGWLFDSSPALPSVLNQHAPPFGLGFERKVDELITGRTRSNVAFRVFEYAYSGGGPKSDARLASLALPLALPDLFVSTTGPRSGLPYPSLALEPGLGVWAANPGYARQVLTPPVLAAVAAFGAAGHRVDLSIDGANLVSVGAPKAPDLLEAYLDLLAPIAEALDPAFLAPYAQAPIPSGFTFYGRPDWVLVGRDDSLIAEFGLTRAGSGHRTENVVRGHNDGLPIVAFVHRWQTTRTETSTDSAGRTQTRTVTEYHSEVVTAVLLPFDVPLLSVDGGRGGKKVRFESEEFNDRFPVRTDNLRFAYDVIHPRTMEFLMEVQPPGFRIESRTVRFSMSEHDTLLIGTCADFAHDFFGRVPSFVWANLQATPPPFRLSSRTSSAGHSARRTPTGPYQ